MLNFLKKQPIEFYALVIVPLIWILSFVIFNQEFLVNLKSSALQSVGFYAFFGGPFYELAFLFLYNYLVIKACLFLKDLWFARQNFPNENLGSQIKQKISAARLYPHFKSLILIFLPIGITGLANGLATWTLAWVPAEKVAQASFIINEWNYKIFGVYPSFWLQKFNGWLSDAILINAYEALTIIFPIVFFGLLMFKKNLFRQFVLTVLIAPMLGYPFWLIWPAITPSAMFTYNSTGAEIPKTIQNEIKNLKLTKLQKEFEKSAGEFWIDKTGRTFAVTSNPSMHAAWGAIMAYFGILLWKPLAIILIPWAIFNSLGAVYTLQHYGIDMFTGTITGILAIVIAIFLLRFEKKYLAPSPQIFLMIDTFQKDCRNFIETSNKILSSIFSKLWIKILN